jgi:hypothetical protein
MADFKYGPSEFAQISPVRVGLPAKGGSRVLVGLGGEFKGHTTTPEATPEQYRQAYELGYAKYVVREEVKVASKKKEGDKKES